MDEQPRRGALDVERTRLANERTFLAWWRTGIAALAIAFAIGRVVPEALDHVTDWPYIVLGVVTALAGIAILGYGARRYRTTAEAISGGRPAPPDDRVLFALAAAGVAVGIVTVLLVAFRV